MIQVCVEKSFNNTFESFKNINTVSIISRSVHDDIKVMNPIGLMKNFYACIRINECCRFADNNNHYSITRPHEFENIVLNASCGINDNIITSRFKL